MQSLYLYSIDPYVGIRVLYQGIQVQEYYTKVSQVSDYYKRIFGNNSIIPKYQRYMSMWVKLRN